MAQAHEHLHDSTTNQRQVAVLGCAALCCAALRWAGLGWAGLGWAGLGWAGLGWAGLGCNDSQQQQSDAPSDAVKPFQFNGGTEHLLIVNLP